MTAKWQPEVWQLDGLTIFQRPGRGANVPGAAPGAALRLPPANFRRPSGARSRRGQNFVAHPKPHGRIPKLLVGQRRQRNLNDRKMAARSLAMGWLTIFQRPGRGANLPGAPPGAALRLPPANFRRPSGARSDCRAVANGDAGLWQFPATPPPEFNMTI